MRGGCVVSQWPIRRRELDRGKGKTALLSEETLQPVPKWNYTWLSSKLEPVERAESRDSWICIHMLAKLECDAKLVIEKLLRYSCQSRWVNVTSWFVCFSLTETNTQADGGAFFSSCRRTWVLIYRTTATPSMAFRVSTRAPRTWSSTRPPKSAPLVSRWWRKWR